MMTHLCPPAQAVFLSAGMESSMGILDKVAEIAGALAALAQETLNGTDTACDADPQA